MVDQTEKAHRFRALHARSTPLVLPNPWDAGTAHVFAKLGFEALTTTSAGLAWSLGRLDGSVSRDEALANARTIVAATDLPVAADLENGYGHDPATVAQTIILAADCGLVGASIEDATGDDSQPLYSIDDAVARVAAAAAAARSLPFPFTLVARAENFLRGVEDLDDTIARLAAYERAGADVLYAPFLPNKEAIERVCAALTKPVNVLAAGPTISLSVAQLGALGVRRISLGSGLARVAFGACIQAATEIAREGRFERVNEALASSEIAKFFAA